MTDSPKRHTLLIGSIDALAAGIARSFTETEVVTSFAFDTSDGDDAIRFVSEAQLNPERMRAVNFGNPEALTSQLLSFEPLDCAVLLPRWFNSGRVLELSHSDWDAALGQNVEEAIYTLQAIAKLLIRQGNGGHIVVVLGLPVPLAGLSAVTASHAALASMCRQAALELAAHNITLNMVQTGWLEHPDRSAAELEQLEEHIPLKALASTADVGAACTFLASPAAAYLTGVSLPVDGGFMLGQRS